MTHELMLNMNKKEIESFLNSCLKDFNKTSIDSSTLKGEMYEHLKNYMGDFNLTPKDYHNNAFSFFVGSLRISVKTGVKTTKEIVKLTELRNTFVKAKGKFKIYKITHGINDFSYEFANEKEWKMKIKSYIYSRFSKVFLTDINLPLKDMLSVDFLTDTLNKQEQSDKNWKGLRAEIENSVAQPVIHKHLMILWGEKIFKKSELTFFPTVYYNKLPENSSSAELFNLIVSTVADINKDLIDDVINNKTFNLVF